MNALLRHGFVVAVGAGFVGRFEWSKNLHLFPKLEQAVVWSTALEAERVADDVFGGLISGVGFGDRSVIRVVSLIEATR